MASEREILTERIQQRLEEQDMSPRALSIEATGKPDVIRDMLRRRTIPNADRLAKIAEILGTTSDWLLGRSESPEQVRSEVSLRDINQAWRGPDRAGPPIPLVGSGDCADLEVCDSSGQMAFVERSSFDPDYHVRYIARPPALLGAKDLYAIYFHGGSMEPRFEAGEVGIVDPRRPARLGDYVVVQLREDRTDDVGGVIVKRLIGQNAKEYTLEQFNPPLTFTLPRAKVKHLHRIIPQTDLLFG